MSNLRYTFKATTDNIVLTFVERFLQALLKKEIKKTEQEIIL